MMVSNDIRPLIFWDGLPACGMLMKQVCSKYGENIKILATRSQIDFHNLELILGHEVIWLKNANDIWKLRKNFYDRNIIIHTNWNNIGWLCFDIWLKVRNKYTIIFVALDNISRQTIKQYLGRIYYRCFLSMIFDGAFVPGKRSIEFMRSMGVPANRIITSNYGALESIYFTNSAVERTNEFVFIGQLIYRKGIDLLVSAYAEYKSAGGTWDLRIIGEGPLSEHIKSQKTSGLKLEGSLQPHEICLILQRSKCLIHPAREDNWATVLAESAACGNILLASSETGASIDLIEEGVNGYIFKTNSIKEIAMKMKEIESWSPCKLKSGSEYSSNISKKYSSESYFKGFEQIVSIYLSKKF